MRGDRRVFDECQKHKASDEASAVRLHQRIGQPKVDLGFLQSGLAG